jgi:hypothetical protein
VQGDVRIQEAVPDDPRWGEFVRAFPRANIFHSPEMAKVFSASEGFEIFPLFALVEERVVAAAFPVLVKIHSPLPAWCTNRLIMYASPLHIRSDEGIKGMNALLRSAGSLASKRALFLEIRHSEPFPVAETFAALEKALYIPYQNYLVDLTVGPDVLWKSYSSFTRNHVRKNEKKGAVIRELAAHEIDGAIQLIGNLYRRKKIPVLDHSVFRNAYEILAPSGMLRVIGLEIESRIVAVRMSLNYGATVYDWYAASDPDFHGYYPNEALAWNTIRWGATSGYTIFDFGGGAIRGREYGPARFKEKFMGALVEFGRHRLIQRPLVYRIASKVYDLRTGQRGPSSGPDAEPETVKIKTTPRTGEE